MPYLQYYPIHSGMISTGEQRRLNRDKEASHQMVALSYNT
jgi:hypothetical protein